MSSASVKASFAIHEAVVLTGFSKHMLDYLARESILRPVREDGLAGRGRPRRYSYADIVLLRALNAICAGAGRIKHLRKGLTALRDELGHLRPGQRLDKLLFVEGDELCLRTGREGGRQLRNGQLTFGFVVDLGPITRELGDALSTGTGSVALATPAANLAEVERLRNWKPIRDRRLRGAGV